MNAQLNKSLENPGWAGVWIYLSGLGGMLAALAVFRIAAPSGATISQTPWWAWLGGLVSVGSTMGGLVYAQKMGSGVFTGLTLTAAVVTSLLFDHFGLLGFKPHPISLGRAVGGAIMIAGLWLVAKT